MKALLLGAALAGVASTVPLSPTAGKQSSTAARADTLTGVVQPSRTVRLGAGIDGLVQDVPVERGDLVQAGQTIATLATDVERANAALAKARMQSTSARRSAEARLGVARTRADRHASLRSQGIVSTEELDQARLEVQLQELALLEAREAERVARLEYERASAILDQGIIRTPIDGVVVERFLSAGEWLSRSGTREVAVVARLHPLVVDLHAPLSHLSRVLVGQQAQVRIEGFEHAPVIATVTVVGGIVDTASSTFPIRLELPNPDLALPAGVRCSIRFLDPGR